MIDSAFLISGCPHAQDTPILLFLLSRPLSSRSRDPGLANHGDPDLARAGQLLLDLLGHVPEPSTPPMSPAANSSIRSSRLKYASRLCPGGPGRSPQQASEAWVRTASIGCSGISRCSAPQCHPLGQVTKAMIRKSALAFQPRKQIIGLPGNPIKRPRS